MKSRGDIRRYPGGYFEMLTKLSAISRLVCGSLSARLVLAALLLSFISMAQAQGPLVLGLDHIPVVVRDLDKAQADFHALGFSIKPGRFHADGIRNAHVKFPDGTEIELITATHATDDLTSEYRARMKKGDGPVYFGLFAPNRDALAARFKDLGIGALEDDGMFTFPRTSPLHPLFLGQRNKTSTDKPEHFAHQNSATRLSGLWVRDGPTLQQVLNDLRVPLTPMDSCGVLGISRGVRASLPEGDLYLVPLAADRVVAARVEVRSLSDVEDVLNANGVPTKKDSSCGTEAVWVPPENGHGIWIEFALPEETKRTGKHSQ
jgi:Glyoxalase-like domain